MNIDIRTVILIIGLTHLMQATVFYYQYRVNKTYNGIGWWLLWSIVEIIGFICLLLRDIPSIFSAVIIVQNTAIISGTIFIYIGIMRFFNKKEDLRIILPIFFSFLCGFLYFLFVENNIQIRSVLISATLTVISFLTAYSLYKNKIKSISTTVNFNTVIFILHGSIFAYRTLMIMAGNSVTDLFTPTLFNIVPYFDALIVALLWTFGFVLMVNHRLNAEMSEYAQLLETKNAQIEKQNRELGRLHILNQKIFSVISHDFKGPMLSLQLLLKTIENKNINEDHFSKYTSDISDQLIQANLVLDNLLNWAKTELNISVSEKFSSRPFYIANEISAQMQSLAGNKNIKINNGIPENISFHIPPDILRIVFRNFLSNAIKFSFENSAVELDYDPENNYLRIIDCGVGIDENKLKQLLRQDVMSSLGTWKETGFGLGLYITHELLNRFNGTIQIEKNIPKGTIFNIFIPLEK